MSKKDLQRLLEQLPEEPRISQAEMVARVKKLLKPGGGDLGNKNIRDLAHA